MALTTSMCVACLQVMEMYCDVESRGGILEPPGICEVKFRGTEQTTKMHQLDHILQVKCEPPCNTLRSPTLKLHRLDHTRATW